MKIRIVSLLLAITLFCGILCGCTKDFSQTTDSGKIDIVCTVSAVYDWILEVIGENAESFNVKLLSGGGDIHSYQPSAADIAKIHTCDLLVYVGGETDNWVEKPVFDKGINSLRLFDVNRGQLLVSENSHEHTHEHSHEHSDEEYDEHIWLSLRIAKRSVNAICGAVSALDRENEELYLKNAKAYCERLESLDKEYMKAVENSGDKTIIFADRFPFLYMTEDYKIECFAAFPGCSSDINASFETVINLAEKQKELQKKTVLVLENSNHTVADAVISASGIEGSETLVMNSYQLQNRLSSQSGGYLNIMKENLKVLKKALE